MKDFELTQKMLSLGGVFYPTGYAFIMFPVVEDATQVARELETDTVGLMLLTPATILTQIAKADGHSDVMLPSVGTEGATVRKYVDLAREGHHALMIPAPGHLPAILPSSAKHRTNVSFQRRLATAAGH